MAAGASHTFNGNFTQVPSLQMPNPPTNVATVEAAATAGGAKILHGTSNTATCPQVQFDASLTVTKSCTSRVEVQSNRVVVAIDFTGTACNVAPDPASGEFPSPIDNVTITDDPAAAGGVINLGTLATGECKNYTATYYPSTIVGTGNPHDQTYTDTVTVAGTARFTGAAKANTASANCPLCP